MKLVLGKHGRSSWPLEKRIENKIRADECGCWLWLGAKQKSGHGIIAINKTNLGAHRVIYEIHKGEIPKGLVLDHLCRTPSCVNPDHLEPVTQRENLMRAETVSGINARKTHCVNGHPLSGENLKIYRRGTRVCVTCSRASNAKYNEKRKSHEN